MASSPGGPPLRQECSFWIALPRSVAQRFATATIVSSFRHLESGDNLSRLLSESYVGCKLRRTYADAIMKTAIATTMNHALKIAWQLLARSQSKSL